MLINEDRLRELYAAGEIDLEQLERSLDIINERREAASRRPAKSASASAPLTEDERRAMLDAAPAVPLRHREPVRMCPQCRSPVRNFNAATMSAWCEHCGGNVSLDPYAGTEAPEPAHGDWIVGGFFDLG